MPQAFIWTCPSCGVLVRTELSPAQEAVLRCSSCGKVFGEDEEPSRRKSAGKRRTPPPTPRAE